MTIRSDTDAALGWRVFGTFILDWNAGEMSTRAVEQDAASIPGSSTSFISISSVRTPVPAIYVARSQQEVSVSYSDPHQQ